MEMRLLIMASVCSIVLAGACRADSPPATLDDFFGVFVGQATVENFGSDEIGQRDMDIIIEPDEDGGFRIQWINVSLVDGRRDLPGVERRVQTALFQPAEDAQFFMEVSGGSPFQERQAMRPIAGDALRWAALVDDTLRVTTFQVLDDGRYEMQIYDRQLSDTGLAVGFERIVDDEVVRRIIGNTARANVDSTDE